MISFNDFGLLQFLYSIYITPKQIIATNKINKVYGILNGTTNYILSEMESSNQTLDKVLQKAQKLGFAEPGNPKLDLNGFDAFAKLRI